MDHSKIRESWTRILEGDGLSDSEQSALMALLNDRQSPIAFELSEDLQTHQTLQALRVLDEIGDEETEQFLANLMPQLDSDQSIGTSVAEQHEPTEHKVRSSRRLHFAVNVALAIAACLLLAVVGWMNRSYSPNSVQPGTQDLAGEGLDPIVAPPTLDDQGQPNSVPPTNVELDSMIVGSDQGLRSPQPIELNVPTDHSADPALQIADAARDGVQPDTMSQPIELSEDGSDSRKLASVTESNEAVWADDGRPSDDFELPMKLVSGKATLRLRDGAEIRLTGPAELQIVGSNEAELIVGTVNTRVPRSAIGFQLQAPGVRVIDLGTEFLVTAHKETKYTSVQVTEGIVETVQKPAVRRGRERRYKLVQGDTKWFPKDNGQAYDWVLNLDLRRDEASPETILIQDKAFDLSQRDGRIDAGLELDHQVQIGRDLARKSSPENRFLGMIVLSGKAQEIRTRRDRVAMMSLDGKLAMRASEWTKKLTWQQQQEERKERLSRQRKAN